ncbi:uncharacterized protein [Aristolochia californica]|uniref:uncharacterized protein n=1 Tax=Aristolochia californica TaxID=171875 RepID=UPI0035E105E9
MELELGLKIRRARDNLSSDIQISKKYGGPLFTSTETETMFILVGHLPGFKKDEIKIEINDSGSEIAVSGQTYIQEMAMVRWRLQMKEPNKRYFRKVFRIPESVILDEIKAWFDDEETSLTIFMPKSIKEIQGIQIEEVKEAQVGREKVASTEKTEADGAQTSELNEGIRPEFGQKNEVSECENLGTNHRALSRKDSAADNSEGETSESTRLIQTGKAGSQENMENSDGETPEMNDKVKPYEVGEKETNQEERSEMNEGLHPEVNQEKETGHDETSEMTGLHFEVDQGKETSHDERSVMNDRLHPESDRENEPNEGEISETNPRVQPELLQIAEQDRETLNSVKKESHQLEEKGDKEARHDMQTPDTTETIECSPEVEDRQTEEPEDGSIKENPAVEVPKAAYGTQEKLPMLEEVEDRQTEEPEDGSIKENPAVEVPKAAYGTQEKLPMLEEVEDRRTEEPEDGSIKENPAVEVPKAAYGTQEKLPMLEEEHMDGAAPSLLTRDQNEEDEERSARAADSSEIGCTPNNQDILTPVRGGSEKKGKRYDGRPYTVIAGSAFLVSLIVLTVHLHRSKKQN